MIVLSVFNGMSFGYMALKSLNINVDAFYSSEIDKYTNQATEALFPDVVQLGDITKWQDWEFINKDFNLGDIDLLLAGFPCQAWSMAGKQKGDNDPRGALVHDLINIWQQINACRKALGKGPVKFMFENVKMKKEFLNYINNLFGVEPICINSALLSAQNRVRYYWTNIADIEQPKDKGILLKDIIEHDGDYTYMSDKFVNRQKGRKCLRDDLGGKAVNLSAMEYVKNGRQGDYIKCLSEKEMSYMMRSESKKEHRPRILRAKGMDEKSNTITSSIHKGVPHGVIKCGAMRGRYIIDGKRADHKVKSQAGITTQRIEIRKDEKTNCLTTVQKDNLLIKSAINKNPTYTKDCLQFDPKEKGHGSQCNRVNIPESKHKSLSGTSGGNKHGVVVDAAAFKYRKLTPRECFRLQTVPEHYIDILLNSGISNTQLYKMCGNGWTVDVIAHIFSYLNE